MVDITFDSNGRIARLKKLARNLTREDIFSAVEKYIDSERKVDSYSHSTTYDLIVDGKPYPPKAIFGLAMSKLLGLKVKSSHFSAGSKEPCFIILNELNFEIRRKIKVLKPEQDPLLKIEQKQPKYSTTFEAEVDDLLNSKNLKKPVGVDSPATTEVKVIQHQRDAKVKAWVLKRAKGRCECCEEKAPFTTESERPFLEVHHLIRLKDGGPDTIENCAAVCPNCHRALHYAIDRVERTKVLTDKVKTLI